MILVILHTNEKDVYDENFNLVEQKGDVFVSHGVDIVTGKSIILPSEKWSEFRRHCVDIGGEWYLK